MSFQSKIEKLKLAVLRKINAAATAATLQVPTTVEALNDKLLASETDVNACFITLIYLKLVL